MIGLEWFFAKRLQQGCQGSLRSRLLQLLLGVLLEGGRFKEGAGLFNPVGQQG